jgi:hypothetical protein
MEINNWSIDKKKCIDFAEIILYYMNENIEWNCMHLEFNLISIQSNPMQIQWIRFKFPNWIEFQFNSILFNNWIKIELKWNGYKLTKKVWKMVLEKKKFK